MGLELRALGEFQLELWPGLWWLRAVQLGGGSGVKLSAPKGPLMPALVGDLVQMAQQSQGRCWALVVTPCDDGLSLYFSVSRRGRAQLPVPSSCGRCCRGSRLGADIRSVLCGFSFVFSFFFAHVFFFFPTISPARLPFMPQLHAPVCKLVGWVGASSHSLTSAGLIVWGGRRAWFRSTHSGLICASVNPLPSSAAGEDELRQHSMAPACSSPGT